MSSSNAFALLAASDDEDIESKYTTKRAKQQLQQQKAKEEAEKQRRAVAVQASAQAEAQRVAASLFSVPSSSSGTSSAATSAPQRSAHGNGTQHGNRASPSAQQPNARRAARDRGDNKTFRRTFQVVSVDPDTNTVVLRLHQTDILKVKPNGDVILNSGGWTTWKTMESMNDVLELFNMAVSSSGGPVNAGNWIVEDGHGKRYRYADNMLVPAAAEEDRHRARILLEDYGMPVPAALVPRPVANTARAAGTVAPTSQATSHPPLAAGGSSSAGAMRAPPPARVAGNPTASTAVTNHAMQPAAPVDPALLGPKTNPEEVARQLEQVAAQLNHAHLENVAEEDICTVCWERLRQIVLIPCGHLVLCEECLDEIMEKPEKLCPMCRSEIAEALRVG